LGCDCDIVRQQETRAEEILQNRAPDNKQEDTAELQAADRAHHRSRTEYTAEDAVPEQITMNRAGGGSRSDDGKREDGAGAGARDDRRGRRSARR